MNLQIRELLLSLFGASGPFASLIMIKMHLTQTDYQLWLDATIPFVTLAIMAGIKIYQARLSGQVKTLSHDAPKDAFGNPVIQVHVDTTRLNGEIAALANDPAVKGVVPMGNPAGTTPIPVIKMEAKI